MAPGPNVVQIWGSQRITVQPIVSCNVTDSPVETLGRTNLSEIPTIASVHIRARHHHNAAPSRPAIAIGVNVPATTR